MGDRSEDEIHQIVQRVLNRYAGLSTQAAPAAAGPAAPKTSSSADQSAVGRKVVAIGADHGGFELKEVLKADLAKMGYEVIDVGTHSKDAVDYPDFAYAVARAVADGACELGIVLDGAGIGSCITANKVPGIRAAMCYDAASARNSREHNYANVLTLGAKMLNFAKIQETVEAWLETDYGEARHGRRVAKIMNIEKQYSK